MIYFEGEPEVKRSAISAGAEAGQFPHSRMTWLERLLNPGAAASSDRRSAERQAEDAFNFEMDRRGYTYDTAPGSGYHVIPKTGVTPTLPPPELPEHMRPRQPVAVSQKLFEHRPALANNTPEGRLDLLQQEAMLRMHNR